MEKSILILGNGFLAKHIKKGLPNAVTCSMGIKKYHDAEEIISIYDACQTVINCIGKIGIPNVDWCESHKEETFFSNTVVPLWLDRICHNARKSFIHISTGCIYNDMNGKEFDEFDQPNFCGSIYSLSKLVAENTLALNPYNLILRIRMPITDDLSDERNIINKLLRYEKIIDVPNSMTYIPDFVSILSILIQQESCGIYNAVCEGGIKHSEILELYKKHINPDYKYQVLDYKDFEKMIVAQRSNCVLSVNKLINQGLKPMNIHNAIEAVMLKNKLKVMVENV